MAVTALTRSDETRRAASLLRGVATAPSPRHFFQQTLRPITLDPTTRPLLQVIIDAEEEFDWSQPFDRHNIAVENIRHQAATQRLFERHGIKPTYVVDYAVASQPHGYGPLRELLADKRCEIGAHLQPWVNPPFGETTSDYHSYPGNLPRATEAAKLRVLTETIAESFGERPLIYRAGRYGIGPHSFEILEELGYEIDTSVLPLIDLRGKAGPDLSAIGFEPFWFGARRTLLGIPLTAGYTGILAAHHRALYPLLNTRRAEVWRGKSLASRLRLFDRIHLSPEGFRLSEQKRLMRHLLARGQRIFNLSYHSPSLVPGNTPYVRTDRDRALFLDRIERFLDYFATELGGRFTTPLEIKQQLASGSVS